MIKFAVFVAAVFSMIGMGFAFSKIEIHWVAKIALFAASMWAYLKLYDYDERREARERREVNEPRFQELAGLARAARYRLVVRGSSYFMMSVTALILGGAILLAAFTADDWVFYLGAALFLCMGVALIVLRGIPSLGKPVIVLSTDGFAASLLPFMPWSLVEGIHLQLFGESDRTGSHILSFRIASLAQHIQRAGLLYRLTYRLRSGNTIGLPLRKTSEHPEVIYRMARLLWTQATGRDHEWDPFATERENLALRQFNEKPGESAHILIAEGRRRTDRFLWWCLGAGCLVAAYWVAQVLLR